MVVHWSLSDCKSPQISRTFLADIDNTGQMALILWGIRMFVGYLFLFRGLSSLLIVAVVDFGFKYLTPSFFFLTYLNCRFLWLWKAAREFKEGRKETKKPFTSNFIFGFLITILWRRKLSRISRNMSRFPDKALKYSSNFWWFICFHFVGCRRC